MSEVTYYIHTINGKVAEFHNGMVVYANQFGKPTRACISLQQIRLEQRKSDKYRTEKGLETDDVRMGYKRIRVPVNRGVE